MHLVGLQLAQQVIGRRTAVDGQARQLHAALARHEIDDIAHLEGDGLEGGAHDVGARRAAGDADDRAARVGIPIGCTEPGERGNEDDAAAVGHRLGKRLRLARTRDDLQTIAQPLHRCAGDEDRALERIRQRAVVAAECHRREQAARRGHRALAGVDEQEGPRAVGALGIAGREPGLPHEGGLLVPGDPGDGQVEPEEGGRIRAADLAVRRHDLGQRIEGHAEECRELRAPLPGADVEQQRA